MRRRVERDFIRYVRIQNRLRAFRYRRASRRGCRYLRFQPAGMLVERTGRVKGTGQKVSRGAVKPPVSISLKVPRVGCGVSLPDPHATFRTSAQRPQKHPCQ